MSEETVNINTRAMLPIGTLLQDGKYRIERHLSSGGFGNTYVATNTKFEEQVAIKEFFMRGVSGRGADSVTVSVTNEENSEQFNGQMEKFRKEARRLRRLHNDHIVAVHDLFDENGTAYYEMELIKGESLSDRMKRTGQPLSEQEALDVLRQVLDALQVVHAQGLYHLDLKPGNIMVDHEGKALLIDFGASKQISQGDGYSVSTSSAMAFTPGYAPLEQTEQNMKSFGPWTDLYALGATLYKLLTNLTPPSPSEILMSSTPLVFPTPVSSKTQQLIAWMMKPRLDQRPQSVAEVKQYLDDMAPEPDPETVLIQEPKPAPKPGPTPPPTPKPTPKPKPQPASDPKGSTSFGKGMIWLGIGVGIFAAIVTAVLMLLMSQAEQVPFDTSPRADEVITVNGVSFKMIGVQGGTFHMGSDDSEALEDEKPVHRVNLSTFSIGETEVTQELWQAVMGSNPSTFKDPNNPVETVSWEDCQIFIRELNKLTGRHFRLPTEAEWEYAARGGHKSQWYYRYSGSNSIDSVAWYMDNSGSSIHRVATKQANELGLYDMSGNVQEWCQDWSGKYKPDDLQTNPTGPSSGPCHMLRGGSFDYPAQHHRVSSRNFREPSFTGNWLGLRLAL